MTLESSPRAAVLDVEALGPGGALVDVLAELEEHARRKRIAIVGHEPGIGGLAARLISATRVVEFKKGAVARIDVDALPPKDPGVLRWFLAPKFLRGLKA